MLPQPKQTEKARSSHRKQDQARARARDVVHAVVALFSLFFIYVIIFYYYFKNHGSSRSRVQLLPRGALGL
jgi:lipopolysaccharide/colanic/teichoic acid biosynthesis glycosyltransferase